MSKKIFVFVVCGAREHIETLHFSLEYLKKYSKSEIWVVTDSSRNEIEIQHNHQIIIQTPSTYTNHQASIYLKTGLHLFLPKGNLYCYLDTDVVALTNEVDEIFNEFLSPIRFAPDHCTLKSFSSSAVNCGCEILRETNKALFLEVDAQLKLHGIDPELTAKRNQLEAIFLQVNSSWYSKFWNRIKFKYAKNIFKLNEDFYFDKFNGVWRDHTHVAVLYESHNREIEKATNFSYNEITNTWFDQNGNDLWSEDCDHLVDLISQTFGIQIMNTSWQHWNGGVFLFNDESHFFLDAWHLKCKEIFSLNEWKTRDQGTLIATVWEFGLENQPCLDKKWNFLADSNNEAIDFNAQGLFTDQNWENEYRVNLVHIYHRFGDTSWDLWNYILKIK